MARCNQFTNLTFSEFEQFVDEWISRTPDMYNLFDNQADESTRLFKQIERNNEKCSIINSHLQIIKYYTDLLERSLKVNNELLQHLEKRVLEVEAITGPLYEAKSAAVDQLRQKIYGCALDVSEILNEATDELYDLTIIIMKCDDEAIKDPASVQLNLTSKLAIANVNLPLQCAPNVKTKIRFEDKNVSRRSELITRILMHQLYNLERIEAKIQKAEDQCQIIGCKFGCQLRFTPKLSREIPAPPYINLF